MVPADSRRIPRVPRYSGYHYAQSRFAYRALTVCGGPFQGPSARDHDTRSWSYYPDAALRQRRFGLFPVRSPLLGESRLMSFPLGTEMFHFPRFASLTLCIQVRILLAQWVPPFGNLRIKVCSQLPEAYRSVPRPSSPLIAKASTRCTLTLEF